MQNTLFTTKVLHLSTKEAQADPGAVCTSTLADLLLTSRWKDRVEAVRAEADPDRQKALKEKLPLILPSLAEGSTLHPQHFIHSGFVVLDLDAKDNPRVEGFDTLKERIAAVPYVAYCGRSCRGKGWMLLVPITAPSLHREIYGSLLDDFAKIGLTLDPSCINLNRARFVSYDPDPYVNTGAVSYGKVRQHNRELVRRAEGRELTDADTDAHLNAILEEVEAKKVDVTGSRRQWIEMLIALANTYGEGGRSYAHRVSRFYPSYTPEETDKEFSDLLTRKDYAIGMGTFFHHARQELNRHAFDVALAEEDSF